MNRKPIHILQILIFSFVLLAACSPREIGESLRAQTALRQQLIEEFGAHKIGTEVQNGSALGISFVNSPYNELNEDLKNEMAHRIALFAYQNYEASEQIDNVWVAFVIDRRYIIFSYTNSLSTYFFTSEELAARSE